jgi:hypothetical protein
VVARKGGTVDAKTLQHFRDLAEGLSQRKMMDVTISFTRKDGGKEVMQAKYDGLFSTVQLGSTTVPARELTTWLKLLYGADVKTVNITY